METELYVKAEKFEKLKVRSVPSDWNGGHFPFVIFVWNIIIEGGRTWQRLLFYTFQFFLLMPIALVFDLIILIVVYSLKLFWFLLIKTIDLIFEFLKIFFQSLSKAVGRVLSWVIVISFIVLLSLFVYLNWDMTKTLILSLKELFI